MTPGAYPRVTPRVTPGVRLGSCGEYLQPQPISDTSFVAVKYVDGVYQLCRVIKGSTTMLTSGSSFSLNPRLSPNGLSVTYEKRDPTSGFWHVFKIGVDGTGETQLTDGTYDFHTPVYSPDGSYVAYTKWPQDGSGAAPYSQVCYIPVDLSTAEVALNASADAVRECPCWSPNGQHIVYQRDVEAEGLLGPGRIRAAKQIAQVSTCLPLASGITGSHARIAFALFPSRPNPFTMATSISYSVRVAGQVELLICDATGRAVTELVHSSQAPGPHMVAWRGTDSRGKDVPSGVYYCLLKSGDKVARQRMLLLR